MKGWLVSTRVLGAGVGLGLLLHTSIAFAFAEDICFPSRGARPVNCAPLPPVCQPVGTASDACLAATTVTLAAENATQSAGMVSGMRSMIHADCVNLLAQAVGFSADDANWISAYGEVPDYGQFQPTDMTGQPLAEGAYKTAEMDGFKRTSFSVGGALYHYVPLYNGGSATAPAGVDGLKPNTQAPSTEYFIAHVRRWVMAGSGTSPPLCAGGLTNKSAGGDYATGDGCFALQGQPAKVDWTWALVGPAKQTYTFDTGLQVINSPSSGAVLSSDFDAVVGNDPVRSANARLGIYLHMVADRISHHACTDTSSMAGPNGSGSSTWSESETATKYCQQSYHSLFHMWETGVDFARVPSANRTTEAALDVLYDELVAFATGAQDRSLGRRRFREKKRAGAGDAVRVAGRGRGRAYHGHGEGRVRQWVPAVPRRADVQQPQRKRRHRARQRPHEGWRWTWLRVLDGG